MARELIIMRHAKSSWESPTTDHARVLNDRGRAEAPNTAQKLLDLQLLPQKILCSDAQRTRQTLELVEGVFNKTIQTEFRSDLYQATLENILDILRVQPDTMTKLMLIGHNPWCEELVEFCVTDFYEMKPAFAAVLKTKNSWRDAFEKTGAFKLVTMVKPG